MDMAILKRPKVLYVLLSMLIIFLLIDPLNISLIHNNTQPHSSAGISTKAKPIQPFSYISSALLNQINTQNADAAMHTNAQHSDVVTHTNSISNVLNSDNTYNIIFDNITNINLAQAFAYKLYKSGYHVLFHQTISEDGHAAIITVGSFASKDKARRAYIKLATIQNNMDSMPQQI